MDHDVRPAVPVQVRHDERPDRGEVAREYALALAYRAGDTLLAAGRWDEASAKFRAVYDADPLYLAWLPSTLRLRMMLALLGWNGIWTECLAARIPARRQSSCGILQDTQMAPTPWARARMTRRGTCVPQRRSWSRCKMSCQT